MLHRNLVQWTSRFSRLDVSWARIGYAAEARNVKMLSRKRNVFLEPSQLEGDALEALQNLYGSNRFNDDEASQVATPQEEIVNEPESSGHVNGSGEVLLPPARNVRVRSATFVKSSVSVKDCPPAVFPEFAVIGRSNVGKSSLINLLTGRSSLALVSKTPGKTRCINHFLINRSWYLVDLPGYGYARTSKENIMGWNQFTRDYFLERETLVSVLLLIDASIPPMELDLACANWLAEAEVPYTLVYTKVDKRKKGVPPASENIDAFESRLSEAWDTLPTAVATSSRSGMGKSELLAHIARLRGLYNDHKS